MFECWIVTPDSSSTSPREGKANILHLELVILGGWLLGTGALPLPAPCPFLLTSRLVFGAFAELSQSGFTHLCRG
jgi:hypothetical protein